MTRTVTADRSALPRRWLQLARDDPDCFQPGVGPGDMGDGQSPHARGIPGPPHSGNSLLSANRAVESQRDAVLRYLPTNLSAPDIARELSVSVTTVRTRIRHLFVKLDAHRI